MKARFSKPAWALVLFPLLAGATAQAAPPPSADKEQLQRAVDSASARLWAYATGEARSLIEPWSGSEGDADVQMVLGRILAQEKNYTAARARFQKAAQLRPNDAAPRVFLGDALAAGSDAGAAKTAYQEASRLARAQVEANPGDGRAHYYLGVALQGLESFADAATHLEQAHKLQPDNTLALYQLGATRALAEQWQPAFDLLTQAIEKNSGIAYAYYYRGLAASKVRRKDLMVNDFHRFLALAPEAPEAPRVRRLLAAISG